MFDIDMSEVATPIIQESIKGLSQHLGIAANEIVVVLKPIDNDFNFKVEIFKIVKKDGVSNLTRQMDMTVKEFININAT